MIRSYYYALIARPVSFGPFFCCFVVYRLRMMIWSYQSTAAHIVVLCAAIHLHCIHHCTAECCFCKYLARCWEGD